MKKLTLLFLYIFFAASSCFAMETSTDITHQLFKCVYSNRKDSEYSQKYKSHMFFLNQLNNSFKSYQDILDQREKFPKNCDVEYASCKQIVDDLNILKQNLSDIRKINQHSEFCEPFREYCIDAIIVKINDEERPLVASLSLIKKSINRLATFSLEKSNIIYETDTDEWINEVFVTSNRELLKDEYLLKLFNQRKQEKRTQLMSVLQENQENQPISENLDKEKECTEQKDNLKNKQLEELNFIKILLKKCTLSDPAFPKQAIFNLNWIINSIEKDNEESSYLQTGLIVVLYQKIIECFEDKKRLQKQNEQEWAIKDWQLEELTSIKDLIKSFNRKSDQLLINNIGAAINRTKNQDSYQVDLSLVLSLYQTAKKDFEEKKELITQNAELNKQLIIANEALQKLDLNKEILQKLGLTKEILEKNEASTKNTNSFQDEFSRYEKHLSSIDSTIKYTGVGIASCLAIFLIYYFKFAPKNIIVMGH